MKTRKNRSNRNRKQRGGSPFDGMMAKRKVRKGVIMQEKGQQRLDRRTTKCVQRCMERNQVDSEDRNPEAAAERAGGTRKESREQEEQTKEKGAVKLKREEITKIEELANNAVKQKLRIFRTF